jgi:hypothetical protein
VNQATDAIPSAELYQQRLGLQQRLHVLEGELAQLEAERGAAALDGDDALATLRERRRALTEEQGDVAAGLAALAPRIAAAEERERQQRLEELRKIALALCEERMARAIRIDGCLLALAAEVADWQGLGQHLIPLLHELRMGEGALAAVGTLSDMEALRRAFVAGAPNLAVLLDLHLGGERHPLTALDGAHRVAMRLQQPRAVSTEARLVSVEAA